MAYKNKNKKYGGMSVGEDVDVLTPEEIEELKNETEEEKLHRIFDKFYQCEESHKKSGSGLGLSISKRIVELLNGTIECKSKKDSGTTFEVTLLQK